MAMQTYRILASGLTIQRGPGREHVRAVRPRLTRTGAFTDSDADPTLIGIDAELGAVEWGGRVLNECELHVDFWLAVGAIIPHAPPALAPELPPMPQRPEGRARRGEGSG